MIKKQDAIPGTRIKITKNPLSSMTNSVDKNGNKFIEGFITTGPVGVWPDTKFVPIYTGDTATISTVPKKYSGIQLVGIKLDDKYEEENNPELFCFWVQIYRNAEKI